MMTSQVDVFTLQDFSEMDTAVASVTETVKEQFLSSYVYAGSIWTLIWFINLLIYVQTGPAGEGLPANAGDTRDSVSIPESRKCPGEGNSNPLQYSCLENSIDRGAWWSIIHGVARSHTRLKQLNTDIQKLICCRRSSKRCDHQFDPRAGPR